MAGGSDFREEVAEYEREGFVVLRNVVDATVGPQPGVAFLVKQRVEEGDSVCSTKISSS